MASWCCVTMDSPGGGGGHLGMVRLTGAAPPWGAVAVGGTAKIGGR